MQFIYIENDIRNHPRTRSICRHFPKASIVYCENYAEIFNRKGQNFRLQKQNPSLILAKKHKNHVLPAPPGYGIGGQKNYYFSHMLNCIYDCRYCFLQGMYRSASYVIFVNYDDFEQSIVDTANQYATEAIWFFSGYDCDSLAYEPVTRFLDTFLALFKQVPNAYLELRTKSTQIRSLLSHEPIENCVVAFSFTPEEYSNSLEHGVPSVEKRIDAMEKLQAQGWQLGLRFDPVIFHHDYKKYYNRLFKQIFSRISTDGIHSVSLGAYRIPKVFHQNIAKLYPDEKLFAVPMDEHQGMMYYAREAENEVLDYCRDELIKRIPESIFFSCTPPQNID